MTEDSSQQQPGSLFKDLQKLSQGRGICERDLAKKLDGSELWEVWHIGRRDPNVRRKVEEQLERLIKSLPHIGERAIARVTFNLVDEDLQNLLDKDLRNRNLGARRTALINAIRKKQIEIPGAHSDSRLRAASNDIIQQFCDSLHAKPPLPVPQGPDHVVSPHRGPAPPRDERSLASGGTYAATQLKHLSAPRYKIQTSYVRRHQYHDDFRTIVAEGERLVALLGRPGTGKSRLAEELVAEAKQDHEVLIRLDARSGGPLGSQLAGILGNHGYKVTPQTTEADLRRSFAALVSTPNEAPSFLILDNAEDQNLIHELVPPSSVPIVLVTSTCGPEILPIDRGAAIVIEEMTEQEAILLCESLLPVKRHNRAREVAQALGYLPLAIDHACAGLLSQDAILVDDFLREVSQDSGRIMRNASGREERALTFIYQQVLKHLDQRGKVGKMAGVLLRLVAYLGPTSIPRELVLPAFQSACLSYLSVRADVMDFQAASNELARIHHLQSTLSGLSIHPFTQRLIRSLDSDSGHATEICRHLHEGVRAKLQETDIDTANDDLSLTAWSIHLASITVVLIDCNPQVWHDINLGETALLLVRLHRRSRGLTTIVSMFEGEASRSESSLDYTFSRFLATFLESGLDPISYDLNWYQAFGEWLQHWYSTSPTADRDYFLGMVRLIRRHIEGAANADNLMFDEAERYVSFYLTHIQSLALAGEHQEALELLGRVIDLVAIVDDGTSRFIKYRGDLARIHGDCDLALGSFASADRSYRQALEIYKNTTADPVDSLEALRGCVEVEIYLSCLGQDTEQLMSGYILNLSEYEDRPGAELAAATHVLARVHHYRLLHLYAQHLSQAPIHGRDNLLDAHERVAATSMLSVLSSIQFGSTRVASDLFDEWILLATLRSTVEAGDSQTIKQALASSSTVATRRGGTASSPTADELASMFRDEVETLLSRRTPGGEQFAVETCYRAVIAREKIAVLFGFAGSWSVHRLLRLAFDVALNHEFAYWYCECLVLACGAARLCGESFDTLLPPLREGLEEIQRLDRWDSLVAVLSHSSNDLDGFRQRFCALLAY